MRGYGGVGEEVDVVYIMKTLWEHGSSHGGVGGEEAVRSWCTHGGGEAKEAVGAWFQPLRSRGRGSSISVHYRGTVGAWF